MMKIKRTQWLIHFLIIPDLGPPQTAGEESDDSKPPSRNGCRQAFREINYRSERHPLF